MKKRIFSIALALVMLLALAVPALAAEEPEPEYRLASVTKTYSDGSSGTYTFAYGQGGYLPTEVFRDGASYATASYDEEGRILAYQDADGASNSRQYDDDENSAEYSSTFSAASFTFEQHIKSIYDDAGNKLTETSEVNRSDGGTSITQTEYTYDENGNLLTETFEGEAYGASSSSRTEYTYDDEGNRTGYTKTSTDPAGTETTEERAYAYTFVDEERIVTETNTETGETVLITHYYPSPLFEAEWLSEPSFGYSGFRLTFTDTAGNSAYTLDLTISEPTASYDDNGCLVKLDNGAGESIELTYEPVA